jgi:hypothetical protein
MVICSGTVAICGFGFGISIDSSGSFWNTIPCAILLSFICPSVACRALKGREPAVFG